MRHAWETEINYEDGGALAELNQYAWSAKSGHHGYECTNCGERVDVHELPFGDVGELLNDDNCSLTKPSKRDDSDLFVFIVACDRTHMDMKMNRDIPNSPFDSTFSAQYRVNPDFDIEFRAQRVEAVRSLTESKARDFLNSISLGDGAYG